MRLTLALSQVNYHRHFQRIWKRQGKLQVQELKVPVELQEMNVKIEDATEILYETNTFPRPIPKKVFIPVPPSAIYREKYCYLVDGNIKVSESENQALSLTKTIPYKGLPTKLNSLIGACSIPDQDKLVQKSILQAHLWDSYQDKLPRRPHPTILMYVERRPYGIAYNRKIGSMLEKLVYLSDIAIGKYPACLQRDKVIDAVSNVAIERSGDSVTFKMDCDLLVTAQTPLESFASEDEVEDTKNQEVPNIYPIRHTLDLEKSKEQPHCMPLGRFNGSHIHSIFIGSKTNDAFDEREQLARAISTSFAFCAREAKMKYGEDVKELPEPITLQCIYSDLSNFNFLAYQLNTLELDGNDGIKNQVWIDGPETICDEINRDHLELTNYNPSVFSKVLGLYVNGLHPVSS